MAAKARQELEQLDDRVLAGLISRGDADAVRLVVSRNNQRLFLT